MATTNTAASLLGLFKQVGYEGIVHDLVPETAVLQKRVKFSTPDEKLGSIFVVPVIVAQEGGLTIYNSTNELPTLTGGVPMQMQQAQVDAPATFMQSLISDMAAKRALDRGPSAFDSTIGLIIRNNKLSAMKTLEVQRLYGQTPLALAASSSNTNTTTTVVTIVSAEFTAGFWSGMVNHQFDWYQTDGTTKINANAPFVVKSVSITGKTITFTNSNTTDLAALDSYIAAHANLAQVFFVGTTGGATEQVGLKKIMTNTGSLFNIDAGVYDLWGSNIYDVSSAALTFAKVQSGMAAAAARGLSGDATLLINPTSWKDLLNDLASLRMYDSSYKEAEITNGAKSIKYWSQTGPLEIVPHIYVKPGDAFLFQDDELMRVGACEYGFDLPGNMNGEVFYPVATQPAVELRGMAMEQIFCFKPASMVYFKNIIPTA